MSWQEYVDSSLLGSGHITQAAIIGLDGSLWAHSAGMAVTAPEAAAVLQAYKQPDSLYQAGLTLNGTRFILLRAEDRSIYLRKAQVGLCVVKTGQCVLLATYDTNKTQPGEATKVVEDLADYLLGVGY